MTKVKLYKHPREKRHVRVRGKISGTPDRPRLSVFRSNAHIYAQIIDDVSRKTLAAASDSELKSKKESPESGSKVAAAQEVGKLVGEKALKAGIKRVVFDSGGYDYHGRVKALADGAREAGLVF